MDQIKIGKFISDCRKKQNLTQAALAEKLNITDRAVSKWENGKGLPDSSLMLQLCEILNITVNELLNGEFIKDNDFDYKQVLIEFVKEKQEADKRLLKVEVYIGIMSCVILFASIFFAAFADVKDVIRILAVIFGFIFSFIGFLIALRIEQVAGYYQCKKCGHKYIPTYKEVKMAMHMGRTRYLKCPCCKQKSWNKKVIIK